MALQKRTIPGCQAGTSNTVTWGRGMMKTTIRWGVMAMMVVGPGLLHAAEPVLDTAYVAQLHAELSNQGRWGKDDQLGTLNLVTPKKRKAASRLVKAGISVSLAHPLLTEAAADNSSPFKHTMVATPSERNAWSVDNLEIMFHGFGHSHMDALCHLGHEGEYYNGYPMSGTTAAGCQNGSISAISDGVLTRGILMDIPRLKGKQWLEPGEAVMIEDLEAWEKKARVKVKSGDAVLLHTGRWLRRAELGPWGAGKGFAGFHVSTVRWLKERDVAIVGTDGGLDVYPSGVSGEGAPVHLLVLSSLGMPILDTMDLGAAAKIASDLKRWEFMLTAAPLRVEGGTGSPLNAIATF